jgi:hypothetical protein
MPEFVSGLLDSVMGNPGQDRQNAASNALMGQYTGVADEYSDRNDSIISQFQEMLQSSQGEYTSNFESMLQTFQDRSTSTIDQYTAGMDEAIATYGVGRDNTLKHIDQNTEAAQRRQTQSNAFSGLGNTTFGSSQVAAHGAQGAMQKGMVEEQYATGLSALQQGKTQGETGLRTQFNQQSAGMESGYAGNLAQMQQSGAGQIASMGMNSSGGWSNIMTGGLSQVGQQQFATAGQATMGESITSGLMGAGMSALGGLMMSDRRNKRDITPVGASPSGIPQYTFRYKSVDNTLYHGTMAQDLLETHPEAVKTMDNNVLGVRYDLIDVDFYPVVEEATQ